MGVERMWVYCLKEEKDKNISDDQASNASAGCVVPDAGSAPWSVSPALVCDTNDVEMVATVKRQPSSVAISSQKLFGSLPGSPSRGSLQLERAPAAAGLERDGANAIVSVRDTEYIGAHSASLEKDVAAALHDGDGNGDIVAIRF